VEAAFSPTELSARIPDGPDPPGISTKLMIFMVAHSSGIGLFGGNNEIQISRITNQGNRILFHQ
jgi:hypothetical protein